MLRVLRKKIKKLDGREVLYGGVPVESLRRAGIDVGDEVIVPLSINVNLSEWANWRLEQCAKIDECNKVDSSSLNDISSNCRYVRLFLPETVIEKVMNTQSLNSPLDWLLHEVKKAI